MDTCIACCANTPPSCRHKALSPLCPAWRVPYSLIPISVASFDRNAYPLHHEQREREREIVTNRALFIQLAHLNVALTRRKIICKNPHKICKSPLMHREIVALRGGAFWDYYSSRFEPPPLRRVHDPPHPRS